MSQEPLTLTLDIGTSSARALLWDTQGREVEGVGAQIPYQQRTTSDGGVEMPAEALLNYVGACLDQVMAQAGERASAIRAVGASTYWHALLGLDANGEPLTPIYSWADNRSAAIARRLRTEWDEAAIHARTGCVIHPSYYPSKLLWLRETQPETFDRVASWVSPSEYLYGKLLGTKARRVSVSMASATGLFHQERGEWDTETLALLKLPLEKLSPIRDLPDFARGLQAEYAQRWPPLRDVPFVSAVGDGACGNVGSGCVAPERFAVNLGTSGAIRAVWQEEQGVGCRVSGVGEKPIQEKGEGEKGKSQLPNHPTTQLPNTQHPTPNAQRPTPFGLYRYRVDGQRPIMGAAFSDGGHVYAWFLRTLHLPPAEELEALLAALEPGAHGLTFLPFLAGERSMGWNLDARASLIGMNLDTSPLEILQAAMEAVALRFALAAEKLRGVFPQAKEIIASGGALGHSPVWSQMFADALGQPVTLAAEAEASSRGAALLAMEATGLIGRAGEATARLGRTFTPDAARHARYVEMLAQQQELYAKLIARS